MSGDRHWYKPAQSFTAILTKLMSVTDYLALAYMVIKTSI